MAALVWPFHEVEEPGSAFTLLLVHSECSLIRECSHSHVAQDPQDQALALLLEGARRCLGARADPVFI